jgi:antitoxin (DNA-binding transcriptional repressor) of toxin-antitoxin stability system
MSPRWICDTSVLTLRLDIAKAGKPLVKVVALDAPKAPRRLGFLKGQFKVPEDFNTMGQAEIAKLFGTDK